jgi:ParB/RepB/Spo0J family partition protein
MATESSQTSSARQVRASARPAATAAAVAKEPAAKERYELIQLDHIEPSAFNFRKHFDSDALAELAADIKDNGIVEPVIVRPVPPECVVVEEGKASGKPAWFVYDSRHFDQTSKTVEYLRDFPTEREARDAAPRYELVAGERRWRAARIAAQLTGEKTIPAIIRDYSDRKALEIHIVENDQRADLKPMERAAGFRTMIDRLGYTADEIATKVHKSTSFVYEHLKLTGLPQVAVESLEKGSEAGGISRSVAVLIARIPDEKQREKAAKEIIKGDYRGAPMTFRTAQEHVAKNFMRELKGAPFSLDDALLVAEAGSCTACPHRSGNTPEEYQGKRPDICLMPSCFSKKLEARHDIALKSFRDAGHTILNSAEVKEAFPYGGHNLAYNSKYVALDATCYDDLRQRTYAQVVGKEHKAIIARAPDGTVMQLALKSEVKKILNAGKPKGAAAGGGKLSNASPSQQHKPDPKLVIWQAAMKAALARLVEKSAVKVVPVELLRFAVTNALDMTSDDDEIARGRGIEFKEGEETRALRAYIARADTPQLVSLFAEIEFRESYSHYQSGLGDEHKQLLKIFGVDFEAIRLGVARHRAEWEKKLKTATTKDVIVIEVEPSRLQEKGDIYKSSSTDTISEGKTRQPFEHEGETFVATGATSDYTHAVRVVPRASYKRKSLTYPERCKTGVRGEGFYEGVRVQCQGTECVLTGPRLKCVARGAKKGAAKR